MEHTEHYQGPADGGGGGGTASSFVAFVLAHAGCGEDLIEVRLREVLACWCSRCDEARTFGRGIPGGTTGA